MRINKKGYVTRSRNKKDKRFTEYQYRDWFLVKHNNSGFTGKLILPRINFPKKYVGKRIKLKVEIVEE